MDGRLAILIGLTFVMHLIATLAFSVRIAGTRTGKIALSLALFNILVLVSRTSNGLQAPLLAKRIEHNLAAHTLAGASADFRWLLLATSAATLAGAFLIPTFQRLIGHAVTAFGVYRSMPKLLLRGISRTGVVYLRRSVRIPSQNNLIRMGRRRGVPVRVVVLNTAATAISTVGVFSALYAGYLHPELRSTAANLSGTINGVAMIFMAIFIDPQLSMMTDDVTDGRLSEGAFRQSVTWLVGSRFVGTLLAQTLLIPAAMLIAAVARLL
ncbi:lipid II flippase Amj family protein [Capsulimonas corticalis]